MRNIEASVENYLEMVRDQGASIISAASTLDIYYEAARFIK